MAQAPQPNNDSAVVQTWHKLGVVQKLVLDATFDSGDGSFVAAALDQPIDGFLVRLVTVPNGATPPDDNYDVTICDEAGVDVLQGVGVNRSNVDVEDRQILYLGTNQNFPPIAPSDKLTLHLAGNATPGARTRIVLYFSVLGN